MTKPNEKLEVAIWFDANKHADPIISCSESIRDMLDIICTKNKVVRSDISYEILRPEDDRVPSVPRWLEKIKGSIPRLIVATVKVKASVYREPIGIIGDLDKKDITRLRVITQREHRMAHPNTTPLTDYECDQLIDKLGLQVVMEQLGSNTVH